MSRLPWFLALACLVAPPAFAAEITVDTTEDGADVAANGICGDALGRCTLRAAVQTAEELSGPDDVLLPQGLYTLSLKRDTRVADALTGDLDVTTDVTVIGAGNTHPCEGIGCSSIDAKGAKDRAFDVGIGGRLRLERVVVKNGKAAKDDFNESQLDDEVSGGLVRVEGQLETEDVVLERGSSSDDGGCVGITDGASASLERTLVTGCKAKDGGGAIEADEADLDLDQVTLAASKASDEGGGVEVSGGTLDAVNVTFSGNSAGEGGGLAAESGAEVNLNNCSFVNNKGKDGAALQNDSNGALVEISNSLLRTAGKENNCSGTITSNGGNLENGTGCGLTFVGGDCPDCDPGIVEDLADNGGPVPTHALDSDSEAINLGNNATCAATDARGAARIGNCDAGAFEFGGLVP